MFQITKDTTPILDQQSPTVKSLATQFNQDYTSKNSIKARVAWGSLLDQIRKSDLVCVNSSGEAITGKEAPRLTFEGICRELGCPRSTAYHYINTYITVSTYPQAIQDAAADARLNLALEHIQAAYADMIAKGTLPENPNALEAAGIVAQLEQAPNPNAKGKSPKKSIQQKLIDLFKGVFEFTDEEEVDSGFIRHCMMQAAKESLKPAGLETWQVLVHQLAMDEKASREAARQAAEETVS
jgi:hypothetical protein